MRIQSVGATGVSPVASAASTSKWLDQAGGPAASPQMDPHAQADAWAQDDGAGDVNGYDLSMEIRGMKDKPNSDVKKFRTDAEEAEYWDSTDTSEMDLENADVDVASDLKLTFALRLDPKLIQEMRAIASGQGLGVTQLARSWLIERLRQEKTHQTHVIDSDQLAEKIARNLAEQFDLKIKKTA